MGVPDIRRNSGFWLPGFETGTRRGVCSVLRFMVGDWGAPS
jgi:hypothetical protein